MTTTLKPVKTSEEIDRLVLLASQIWNQHYLPIIGQEQINYMLDKFQSIPAITKQISDEGYLYFFIVADNKEVGYIALVPDQASDKMMLSKIYVSKDARGTGAGTAALNFAKELCRQHGISKLWLTVNRHNSDTINWYKKNGFSVDEEVVSDIGNGFVMDDYIMGMLIPNIQ